MQALVACGWSMSRPKKAVASSRINGAKATNKGKIVSDKVAVLKVKLERNASKELSIGFETVLRAKLHKNVKYADELRAEEHLAAAAAVVRARYLPGVGPAADGGKAFEEARGILAAYQAAAHVEK